MTASSASGAPVLEIDDLGVRFRQSRGKAFQAVEHVSLTVRPGETVGIVGESGSGKTTIGRAVLGLVAPSSGRILYRGDDITQATRSYRRQKVNIQAIFQDPYGSLNPVLPIGETLAEPLRLRGFDRREAMARVQSLIDRVRLPADAVHRLPHEFSGGQRQRIAIARALATEPDVVVCDEPVSALDLSTQATVLDLLIELQRDTGVAYLFVSHDLAVIRHICHRVSVLFRGRIVEQDAAATVTSAPAHPYTKRLLAASPIADPVRQAERRALFEQLEPYNPR